MAFWKTRNRAGRVRELRKTFARKRRARAALTLRDVRCDPIANRALEALMQDYSVAEDESRLVLTNKTGDMKLFLMNSTTSISGTSSATRRWRKRSTDCACWSPR